VVNAVDAIGDHNGSITVDVHPSADGKRVVCEVRDTGCGISPENLEKIFQPFFTTKPEDKGTGLGLPVARGIVESYGGTLVATIGLGGSGRLHYWDGTFHDTAVTWAPTTWYLVTATFDATQRRYDFAVSDATGALLVRVPGLAFAGGSGGLSAECSARVSRGARERGRERGDATRIRERPGRGHREVAALGPPRRRRDECGRQHDGGHQVVDQRVARVTDAGEHRRQDEARGAQRADRAQDAGRGGSHRAGRAERRIQERESSAHTPITTRIGAIATRFCRVNLSSSAPAAARSPASRANAANATSPVTIETRRTISSTSSYARRYAPTAAAPNTRPITR
jgi:hypothetical protein